MNAQAERMNARIALLIPDGVGARNFLLGPFLRCATQDHEVHTVHGIPESMLQNYSRGLGENAHWHPLLPFRERPLAFVLRNSLTYAQMYWADTAAMRIKRSRYVPGSWRTKAAVGVARTLGRISASPHGIRRLDRWHCDVVGRFDEVERYAELFRKIQPTVVMSSHQRPTEILPPVLAARSLGIPTATFIFSWDNLSSKGRVVAPFDHYLVWSEQMRTELLQYYPDVAVEDIHIVGTPQFDPYGDRAIHKTRDEFFRQIGADPARKLICFSCGVPETHVADVGHIRLLCQLIKAGRIQGAPQVLVRPAPTDISGRFLPLVEEFPELILAQPHWLSTRSDSWAGVIPAPDDVEFLANLTYHADLNVNYGSTMTLDFAIRDKPVINIVVEVVKPSPLPRGLTLLGYLEQFVHYKPVLELGAARVARTAEEFTEHVNAYLENPSLDREGRRRFVDLEVGVPVGESSSRIVDVLDQIALSN